MNSQHRHALLPSAPPSGHVAGRRTASTYTRKCCDPAIVIERKAAETSNQHRRNAAEGRERNSWCALTNFRPPGSSSGFGTCGWTTQLSLASPGNSKLGYTSSHKTLRLAC